MQNTLPILGWVVNNATSFYTNTNTVNYPSSTIMILGLIISVLLSYIYSSLTLMITAKKLKVNNSWLAWIPIGNLYLKSKMAKKRWWPVILNALIIPLVFFAVLFYIISVNNMPKNTSSVNDYSMAIYGYLFVISLILIILFAIISRVFDFIWTWKICEERNRPGWWILLIFIPYVGSFWYFIMWGILAWSK